jgi:TctA family transporter
MILGTNSFIPNLIGRLEKNNDGIDVIVRIRPNKIIITILASVFLLLPIIDLFIGEFTITSLIIPLFILVIALLGFNSERKRAKRLLEKALKI